MHPIGLTSNQLNFWNRASIRHLSAAWSSSLQSINNIGTQTLVIIDASVEHSHLLANHVLDGAAVLVLDGNQDGILQITAALRDFKGITHLHIVAHGAPGCLYLGNSELNLETLHHYASELQSWFSAVPAWATPELYLYSCNVAAGDAGTEFIQKLHLLIGAEIAASTHKVGHSSLGGNWVLDTTTGNATISPIFTAEIQASYPGVLAININGPTTEWIAVPSAGNAFDYYNDQQTGSGEGDIVGTANGPGFYLQFDNAGTPGNTTDGTLAFRVRLGSDRPGVGTFDRVFVVGIDANRDGKIDIFAGVNNSGSVDSLAIWRNDPAQANISPSTTGVISPPAVIVPITASNYGFVPVTTTNNPGVSSTDLDADGDTDYFLSFSFSFNQIVSVLASLPTPIIVTDASVIQMVIITAAQDNALNQDIGGFNDQTGDPSLTYAQLGAISIPISFNGTIPNAAPDAVNDSVNALEDAATPINVLGNDTDAEGDAISLDSFTQAANGTVTRNDNGTSMDLSDDTLTYTPNANFNGTDTFTYTVSDSHGGTDTATVTVTVNPVNDAPDAVNDSPISTNEDTLLSNINVLGNDTDIDGDPLTVTTATAPNGTVTINPDGTLSYLPNSNFNGTDTITYEVSDGKGGTDTATVSVTVDPVNDAPDAVNDGPVSTNEDTLLSNINVLGNDTDAEGDPLTVTTATAPNGTVTINPDGTLNYSPNPNFNGTDTITYEVSDSHGGTDTATVTVTVNPVNDAPDAGDDGPVSTNEDTAVTIPVLSNDTDIDGDALTVTTATAPNGTVTINPDGTLSYLPNSNFNGTDTITYEVSDGNGGTDTATVSVTVNPVNDAPIAGDDGPVSTNEDTAVTIPVLGNDTDIDGDPLTVTTATAPNGTVTINPDGSLNYSPNSNFNGTDTITYEVSDGNGGTDTATVSVTVNPVNDAPVAGDDTVSTAEDTAVTIPVLSNDTDVDGDALTVTTATAPNGTVTINPDGTLNYLPNPNFNGPDTITYEVSDGNGGTDTATVSVTVDPVNDAPVAGDDGPVSTNEETLLSNINVLGNDTDVDGDALTVTTATAPNGTVNINPDGTLNYSPNSNFNGTDTITYEVSDGNGGTDTATVSITVNPVNDAPGAVNDGPVSTNEDTAVTIPVLGNDTDIDGDPLSVTTATAPNGTVTINPDGTLSYLPNSNFNGTDTITYEVSDGNGGTDTATVSVTVDPVNDAPDAVNDSPIFTNEDTLLSNINVLGNDTDIDGDLLTVTTATAPNGTVTINPDGTLNYLPNSNFNGTDTITYSISDGNGGTDTAMVSVTVDPVNDAPDAVNDGPVSTNEETLLSNINVLGNDTDAEGDPLTVTTATAPNGTVTINPDGSLNYLPNSNFNGTDTITYEVSDGNGGTDTATVSITVDPVNDAPDAVNDGPISTNEDSLLSNINVLGNDTDVDGDALTVTTATAPNGTVTINPDGTLNYSPNSNFNGTDTITYEVSDGNGGTDTATVSVTVNPVNDAPIAGDDGPVSTNEDTAVTIPVLGNDTDIDGDPLTITTATAPNGTVTINPDGSLNYLPNSNFNGTDTITYEVSDGKGGTDTATVSVTVNPVNDAPVAGDDTVSTAEDTAVTIPVLSNDTDIDGDPLTVTTATAPNGTVTINPDGTLNYSPNSNFNGTDTITYEVSDGKGGTDTATVTVTVNPVNDAPVAGDDTVSTAEDTAVTIPVLSNDTDIDGDALTVTTATAPNGTVTINPDGTLNYSPNSNFNGTDTITYEVSDGNGGTDTATVSVTVNPVNNAPDAVNDTVSTNEDTAVTIPVLGNDTDIDGDPLTVTTATASNGTVTINPDGTLNYLPNPNFNGPDTITYEVSDGNGGADTATVSITVNPVNDAPVAGDDGPVSTNEDTAVTIPVLGNDTDIDGDPLSVTTATAPNGTVTINPDGTLSYLPNSNFNGTDTITYEVSDGKGGTDTATVSVTVTPVNDAPDAGDDGPVSTNEDTAVTIPVLGNDTDIDGDPLTVTTATAPNGTVTINPDGTLNYLPNPNFNGTDTITYEVSDGKGGSDTATVSVTVDPVVDITNDSETTAEDTPVDIDVLANDSFGSGATITNVTDGANGSVTINPDGTIQYTPNADFNGTDGFTYTVTAGGVTETATVTVTIDPIADAVADQRTTREDVAIDINVLGNDSFASSAVVTDVSAAANGTVKINLDGTVNYTPNLNFRGDDSFTYTVTAGGVTETATVMISVSTDIDADGIIDLDDLDDDNDGIVDTAEQQGDPNRDTDNDGVVDSLDLDSDNDGITDLAESGLSAAEIAGLDTNGDGIIDASKLFGTNGLANDVETGADSGSTDYNNDGKADQPLDTDGDGIRDFQDLDADNDGINDVIEAGGTDSDGDGLIDGHASDTDGDGLADQVDPNTKGNPLPSPDIDQDGAANFRDLDADNDGLPDLLEAGFNPDLIDRDRNGVVDGSDTDRDGIQDLTDGTPDRFGDNNGPSNLALPDADKDTIPDYQEIDSDSDGTPDRIEAKLPTGANTPDADANGQIDDPKDTDRDGIADRIDSAIGSFGGFDFQDSDGDGIFDSTDLDDDNDGIPDLDEGTGDTDNDGISNTLDRDSDNDGITDTAEAGGADADGNGLIDSFLDSDRDGLADRVDLDKGGTPLPSFDTDGDGQRDFQDRDSDNDGISDVTEAGGGDPDGDGAVGSGTSIDADQDGLPDLIDVDQSGTPLLILNTDGDSVADYRDLDSDNDGIADVTESGGSDPDGDGIVGNGTPIDSDKDGIADIVDLNSGGAPLIPPDTDGDQRPDYQDLDSDNDGIFDLQEGSGLPDANGDGMVDGSDADKDGLIDLIDGDDARFASVGTPILRPKDENGNGISDFLEPPRRGGSQGSDDVTGTDSDDILNGFSDLDVLRGGNGNDIINGGSDKDVLRGDEGNDILNGGSNDDDMEGGIGNDILNGGTGNDKMLGNDGDDILNGGRGRDSLDGGLGNDLITGNEQNDKLYGGDGTDRLLGDRGNDLLVGGFGKDKMTGGQGRDKFVYSSIKDFGDSVTDFEILKDSFDLKAIFSGSSGSMNEVRLQQRGANTLIQVDVEGWQNLAILKNVDADTITARHFSF